MPKNTVTVYESKFTKGEKCIFTHLVLTFIIILVLIIIYAIHLYVVKHTQYGIFNTRRSLLNTKRTSGYEDLLVGYLLLNITSIKLVCNTLLLRPRWSLSTAHCVTVRSDPDMAHLLYAWRIQYFAIKNFKGQRQVFVTSIRRSIAHSLFSRETFANNIGLLEHTDSYHLPRTHLSNEALTYGAEDRNNIFVIGWNHSDTENKDNRNIESIRYDVFPVNTAKCLEALSPIIVMRNYEFCVTLKHKQNTFLDYGAAVFANSKVLGFFSWGERLHKDLPMVMINITIFHDWLHTIADF